MSESEWWELGILGQGLGEVPGGRAEQSFAPGSQASSRVEAKNSTLLSSCKPHVQTALGEIPHVQTALGETPHARMCRYLALDGVYHPLWAAFPSNPTPGRPGPGAPGAATGLTPSTGWALRLPSP